MDEAIHLLSIAQLGRLISGKEISPVEVVEHYLSRIAMLDGELKSFVLVTSDLARRQAKAAEQEIMAGRYRGRLHGIPFSLKDVYDTRGIPTTAQSHALADNLPAADATVTRRFYEAGAILIGKNATWEFTYGQPSPEDLFPPSRNPWNTNHDPEGSSSGSAAAVAAGLSPVSMGTDTGGSIRDPAAGCGIVGLKPTFGRISRHGVIPNSFSHDHCGPLTWNVEDCAIVMGAVAGYDPLCASSAREVVPDYAVGLDRSISGLRFGIVRNWFETEVRASAAMLAAFEESVRALGELGGSFRDVKLSSLEAHASAKKVVATAELFSVHSRDLRDRPHLLGKSLRYLISTGALITAQDYIAASRWRLELARAMRDAMEEVDLLILPTMAASAPRLEPMRRDAFYSGERSYTTPFNVSGFPAVSLCNGFTAEGMPLSLQIAGRPFDEATVLRAAAAFERATPWRGRRPVLAADPQA